MFRQLPSGRVARYYQLVKMLTLNCLPAMPAISASFSLLQPPAILFRARTGVLSSASTTRDWLASLPGFRSKIIEALPTRRRHRVIVVSRRRNERSSTTLHLAEPPSGSSRFHRRAAVSTHLRRRHGRCSSPSSVSPPAPSPPLPRYSRPLERGTSSSIELEREVADQA